jgi:hypothetical protein
MLDQRNDRATDYLEDGEFESMACFGLVGWVGDAIKKSWATECKRSPILRASSCQRSLASKETSKNPLLACIIFKYLDPRPHPHRVQIPCIFLRIQGMVIVLESQLRKWLECFGLTSKRFLLIGQERYDIWT